MNAALTAISLPRMLSLMSDYEITLINDSMQEFYVRFHGPDESKSTAHWDPN